MAIRHVLATENAKDSGGAFSTYTYELSLAALFTTLVSGAVAERVKISAWCVYCFVSAFIYGVPAGKNGLFECKNVKGFTPQAYLSSSCNNK
jgi:ammonia channel protein AmtB